MKFKRDKYNNIFDIDSVNVSHRVSKKFWRMLDLPFWDVETTSLDYDDPESFRIVQFYAALYDEPAKFEKKAIRKKDMEVFIDPGQAVGPGAMKVHGLYQSDYDKEEDIEAYGKVDLKGFPTMEEAFDSIYNFLASYDIWGGFNLVFDVNALQCEGRRVAGPEFELLRPWVDPLFFQRYIHGSRKNRLSDVARFYGVGAADMANTGGSLHDASVDVDLTASVAYALCPKIPQKVDEMWERLVPLMKYNEVKRK